MTRWRDRLPERHVDPLRQPADFVMRRLRADQEAETRRRLRLLERRASAGGEPAVEQLPDDDELDPEDLQPGRIYRVPAKANRRERLIQRVEQVDGSVTTVDYAGPGGGESGAGGGVWVTWEDNGLNTRVSAHGGNGSVGVAAHAMNGVACLLLSTGAASGNQRWFTSADAATDPSIQQFDNVEATFVFAPLGTTNVVYRFGFSTDWNANPAANGYWIEYADATDTNWQFVTRSGGVQTKTDSGELFLGGGTAFIAKVVRRSSTAVVFAIDQITGLLDNFVEHTANLTASAVAPGGSIRTTNGTAKTLELDHWRVAMLVPRLN